MSTHVVTVPASLPVRELVQQYFLGGTHHKHQGYPVVDAQGRLLGVVTKSNLLDDWVAAVLKGGSDGDIAAGPIITYDLLTRGPVTAYPWESCRVAAERMAVAGVGRVVIVKPEDATQVVGIITRSDLLKPRLPSARRSNAVIGRCCRVRHRCSVWMRTGERSGATHRPASAGAHNERTTRPGPREPYKWWPKPGPSPTSCVTPPAAVMAIVHHAGEHPARYDVQQEQQQWDGDLEQHPDEPHQEHQADEDENRVAVAPEPAGEEAVPPGAVGIAGSRLRGLAAAEPVARLPQLMVIGDVLARVEQARQHGQPDGPPDKDDQLEFNPRRQAQCHRN